MFELIAFASLAAHKELYSEVHTDFTSHWEAAKLVKRLRIINPDFYPSPVVQVNSEVPGVKRDLLPRGPDYLTENDLIVAHGRCGSLMHASNPYGEGIDYGFFESTFPVWRSKIVNLLNVHQIRLPGDTGFYLVQMGSKDERVSCTPFARRDRP